MDTTVGRTDETLDQGFWAKFEAIKLANFDANRCNVFHYSLWAHNLYGPVNQEGGPSGLSQGIFTDDFLVSLGWPNDLFWAKFPDRKVLEAGTFMHEIGHNLGLRHGGAFDFPYFKPNYRSVMSWRYQVTGVDTNCDAEGDGEIDLSDEVLPSLNEQSLVEANGLRGPCQPGHPINWNKSCPDLPEPNPIAADITCTPLNHFTCTVPPQGGGACGAFGLCDSVCCPSLTGFNDWPAIRLDFQNSTLRENPPWVAAIEECSPAGGGGTAESSLKCFGASN